MSISTTLGNDCTCSFIGREKPAVTDASLRSVGGQAALHDRSSLIIALLKIFHIAIPSSEIVYRMNTPNTRNITVFLTLIAVGGITFGTVEAVGHGHVSDDNPNFHLIRVCDIEKTEQTKVYWEYNEETGKWEMAIFTEIDYQVLCTPLFHIHEGEETRRLRVALEMDAWVRKKIEECVEAGGCDEDIQGVPFEELIDYFLAERSIEEGDCPPPPAEPEDDMLGCVVQDTG